MSEVGILVDIAIVAVAAAVLATEGRTRTITLATAILLASLALGSTAAAPHLDEGPKWVALGIVAILVVFMIAKRPKSMSSSSSSWSNKSKKPY